MTSSGQSTRDRDRKDKRETWGGTWRNRKHETESKHHDRLSQTVRNSQRHKGFISLVNIIEDETFFSATGKKKQTSSGEAELNNGDTFHSLLTCFYYILNCCGRWTTETLRCCLSPICSSKPKAAKGTLNELFSLLWFWRLLWENEKHVSAGCRPHPPARWTCTFFFFFYYFEAWLLSQLDALLSFVTVSGDKRCEWNYS